MKNHRLALFYAFLTLIFFSCNSSNNEEYSNSEYDTELTETVDDAENLQSKFKSMFEPFNDVNKIREELSTNGIGILEIWKRDDVGDYMSITSYYEFGEGNSQNNLAYYLEGHNSNSIRSLKLVLNINNGTRESALLKFSDIISKTYKSIGLIPNKKIIKSAKLGKELKIENDKYLEALKLNKSRIETWEFKIETK